MGSPRRTSPTRWASSPRPSRPRPRWRSPIRSRAATALARLTQLAPTAGADPEDDGGAAGGADFGVGLSGLAASDADDGDADEAPDDEDEELGAGFGTDDPSLLPDDPGHTAFDPLHDDEAAPGLGVGFGNEDVDDAAPPEPDALPDLGF